MSRRRKKKNERGQVLMIVAGLLPVLLGMAAMSVDIGSYAAERRSLQSDADAIALAAGRGLPDIDDVNAAADEWAEKNGVDPDSFTISITGGTTTPKVRVEIAKSHPFQFIQIVGIDEAEVGAVAAAEKFSTGSGAGVVPWSVTQETVDAATSGDTVTVKYDANADYDDPGYGSGNFGAIRIDGEGASAYEDAATYGSDYNICSASAPNCDPSSCPGLYPDTCGEDAPECDGEQCESKPGNMTGPTQRAVDFRKAHTSTECDTFEKAFNEVTAYTDALDAEEKYVLAPGGAMPQHHGSGGHPTYTPTGTPTQTSTPAPTATFTPSNTPTATLAPGLTATITPGPSPTPTLTGGFGEGGGSNYSLDPDCNPWTNGACPPAPASDDCSRRVFLIPIVDGFENGSDSVTILGFALVYLEGYIGDCNGSECEIEVRFVQANLTTGASGGAYDPDAPVQFVRLVE